MEVVMANEHETDGKQGDGGDTFDIIVNENPVPITGHRHTGLEIKQAGIAAGLSIDVDFVLSEVAGPGKTRIVGNDEDVTLTKKSRFEAIPNDDHS
jgi:hypothetical protein